ncbi:MAG: outer membrane lipoprotein carrier protein LolA [Endomicrobium sp.]|jgi:outer membrane lipoprotein carrier protein|nr:outer membrane lipoprotein carrier protein LolA [Endomicrobium sp.]
METIKKLSFFTAVVCAFFLISYAFAQENSGLEADFEKFTKVKTIYSSFEMEKYLAIAEQPFVSKGEFYFKAPDSLKWKYSVPFQYGFLIDGKKILSWQDENGKKEVKDISARPAASAALKQLYVFITMDKEQMSKAYRIEKSDGGIILYPKDDSKTQAITNITIAFSKTSASVERVVISEKNGGKTVIIFSGTKIDAELPENAFEI